MFIKCYYDIMMIIVVTSIRLRCVYYSSVMSILLYAMHVLGTR
jgi:hypothetical protein